jgi:UDP-2-acetamido-3-amino-2,3-dideoxy-glucuronate N-acetyltransferase
MSDRNYYAHPSAIIDEGCEIGDGVKIWHFSHIMPGCRIGEGCNIGQNVVVSPKVVLGKNVRIQNNVSIYEGSDLRGRCFSWAFHGVHQCDQSPQRGKQEKEYRQTLVRRGASIGANATIVCGNEIGEFALSEQEPW